MKSLNIIFAICILVAGFFYSCKQDHESLDLSQEAVVTGFSLNGVSGEIDNDNMTIHVVLPPNTDVTSLVPAIQIPTGGTITPIQGMPLNFTDPVKFKVVNGNRYNVYTVLVYVINAQITQFILDDKYQGVIDQSTREITVSVSPTTDVTSMVPSIMMTEGAVLSPKDNVPTDFSNPVHYTLNFMGEVFEYTVRVIPRPEAFAFIGTAADINGLTSLHEKRAAEWMLSTIANSYYISFDDVKSGRVQLGSYDVVWFHYETWITLPSQAYDPTVVAKFKEYYQAGGNILLTSWATQYVGTLAVSKNGPPNNVFGDINAWTVPERWGISYKGNETHPIFNGLQQADNRSYPAAYFIGDNVHRRNAGSMWHIEPAPYNSNKDTWANLTGGVPLAALDWDENRTVHVVVAEFPKVAKGNGAVICIGAPSYEWYNENIGSTVSPANPYLNNMKIITKNVIEYLKK